MPERNRETWSMRLENDLYVVRDAKGSEVIRAPYPRVAVINAIRIAKDRNVAMQVVAEKGASDEV
jgi:hypothetical protein